MMRFEAMVPLVFPLFLICAAAAEQGSQAPGPARLNLVVVEGDGVINNIKQRTARDTIVQVEDENHKPIAGAAVVFLLPADGPGGSFAGGAKTAALVTDGNGQAVMPKFEPNQVNGQFQIRVNASFQGRQGSVVVHQSVAGPGAGAASSAAHAGISGKTIAIIVAVAAAGAVGAAVGLRGGSSTPATPTPPVTPPTGSISGPGSAILGPPR